MGSANNFLGLSARVLARGSRVLARGSRWLDRANHQQELVAGECPLKLNVGCGYDKRDGYLNVDVDPACVPDLLIVDGDYTPIPRRYFEEVLAKDVLEHIPHRETLLVLLDFADYLVDGGKLIVQTPSVVHLAAKLQATRRFAEQWSWIVCLFGNQQHSGDCHYTSWTEVTLQTLLIAAGFKVDTFELRESGWNFYVEARKLSDWTSLLEKASGNNQQFLREAYNTVLGRDADEAETRRFGRLLHEGAPRKQILKHILATPERLFRIAKQREADFYRISTVVPEQHNSARISKFAAIAPSLGIAVETEETMASFAASFVLDAPRGLDGVGEPRVVVDLEVLTGAIGIGCTNADYTSWLDRIQVVPAGSRQEVYVPFGAPFAPAHLVIANYCPEGRSLAHIHGIEIRRVPPPIMSDG